MKIAILCDCSNLTDQAKAATLSEQLCLPIVSHSSDTFTIYVVVADGKVGLWVPEAAQKPYYIDFLSGAIAFRQARQQFQRELIVRACHIKGKDQPLKIVDATAGFGRDAFMLAGSGAEVIMLEKNAIVSVLLQDALERLYEQQSEYHLKLITVDARAGLKQLNDIDVIYLDPMFEEQRRAKVKKDLQLLQALLAQDSMSAGELFDAAYHSGAPRVVVKRALHADHLMNKKPSFSLAGKHTRFDIYLTCSS